MSVSDAHMIFQQSGLSVKLMHIDTVRVSYPITTINRIKSALVAHFVKSNVMTRHINTGSEQRTSDCGLFLK